MQPAKLGYAEVNYGADLKKIVPRAIPNFWRNPKTTIPYITEMELFLDNQLNPKSVFYARDGVDKNDAILHLQSIANSALLSSDDKLAICAFLSSLWFKYVDIIVEVNNK